MQEMDNILKQAQQHLRNTQYPISLITLEWDGDSSGMFLCLDAISIIGSVETPNYEAKSRVRDSQILGDLTVKFNRQVGGRLITYLSSQLGTFINCMDSVDDVRSAVTEMAHSYGVPLVFTNKDFNWENSWWDAIAIISLPVSQERECI